MHLIKKLLEKLIPAKIRSEDEFMTLLKKRSVVDITITPTKSIFIDVYLNQTKYWLCIIANMTNGQRFEFKKVLPDLTHPNNTEHPSVLTKINAFNKASKFSEKIKRILPQILVKICDADGSDIGPDIIRDVSKLKSRNLKILV